MKRGFLLTIAMVMVLTISAQDVDFSQWFLAKDTSAFDGVVTTCGVYGKTNDKVYTHPLLFVSKSVNKEAGFCLNYWPYGGCPGNQLYAKFDKEAESYRLQVVYANGTEAYLIGFYNEKQAARDPATRLTQAQFIKKLTTCKVLYTRFYNSCTAIDVEFTLNRAGEVLRYLE